MGTRSQTLFGNAVVFETPFRSPLRPLPEPSSFFAPFAASRENARAGVCLFLIFLMQASLLPVFAQALLSPPEEAIRSGLAAKFSTMEKANATAIAGADGWLFLSAEFRLLSVGRFWGDAAARVCRSPKPDAADPIPAIRSFQDALKQRGIDLLLVPVPPKMAIYPEKGIPELAGPQGDTAPFLHSFYNELRSGGVDVLDLTPLFLENRASEHGAVFCKTDTHWSGAGCVLAAHAIAEKIRPKLAGLPSGTTYVSEWKDVSIDGDLGALLEPGAQKPGPETIPVRSVSDKATGAAVAPDSESPVLVLGDSHTLVFHDFLAERSGLIDQLALEIGFSPDLLGIRGSGATQVRKDLYRRSIKTPDYLSKKKVVIWCFTAREFTEAAQGWQTLPVAK
jgi:alginate O-acetyltransferase complex protein AlgJ